MAGRPSKMQPDAIMIPGGYILGDPTSCGYAPDHNDKLPPECLVLACGWLAQVALEEEKPRGIMFTYERWPGVTMRGPNG